MVLARKRGELEQQSSTSCSSTNNVAIEYLTCGKTRYLRRARLHEPSKPFRRSSARKKLGKGAGGDARPRLGGSRPLAQTGKNGQQRRWAPRRANQCREGSATAATQRPASVPSRPTTTKKTRARRAPTKRTLSKQHENKTTTDALSLSLSLDSQPLRCHETRP